MLAASPPAEAVVLFDGTDLSAWTMRDGRPAGWKALGGILEVVPGTGDMVSRERFGDFQLHLEFRCPHMPRATGQAKGNSGVFLQGRYEIQVLDSYGVRVPGTGDCGAVYEYHAPLLNACRPALEWQSFEAVFRAARVRDGRVREQARLTLLQNGLVVQNNVELRGPTKSALDDCVGEPGPLRLQDHGDPVAYRNIWLRRLPLMGSDRYEPR